MVWSDNTPGNWEIYFRKSANGGTTWNTAQRLTNNAEDSVYPKIAVDGSKVYVIWAEYTEFYFRMSLNGATTWQDAIMLTNTQGYSTGDGDLEYSGSKIFVVYEDHISGNPEVYFKKSSDGSATWPVTRRVKNNMGQSMYPNIAAGSSAVYAVWSDNTPGNFEIYLKYSPL